MNIIIVNNYVPKTQQAGGFQFIQQSSRVEVLSLTYPDVLLLISEL